MGKVSIQRKLELTKIINTISYPEAVNERLYKEISSGLDTVLPISFQKHRKGVVLECQVSGLIPLARYFEGNVSRRNFFNVVIQIIEVMRSCELLKVNYYNLDLSLETIFINPYTKRLSFVFWPVVNNTRANPPMIFLAKLPHLLLFNPYEDASYLNEYQAFFSSGEAFSLNLLEQLIIRLQRRDSKRELLIKERIDRDSVIEKKGNDKQNSNDDQMCYDPFSGLNQQISKEYICLRDTRKPDRCFRVLVNNRIKIGRGEKNEIVLDFDPTVSTIHCIIHRKGDKLYISDSSSRNGTFVNGVRVIEEEPITNGCVLRIGTGVYVLTIE